MFGFWQKIRRKVKLQNPPPPPPIFSCPTGVSLVFRENIDGRAFFKKIFFGPLGYGPRIMSKVLSFPLRKSFKKIFLPCPLWHLIFDPLCEIGGCSSNTKLLLEVAASPARYHLIGKKGDWVVGWNFVFPLIRILNGWNRRAFESPVKFVLRRRYARLP